MLAESSIRQRWQREHAIWETHNLRTYNQSPGGITESSEPSTATPKHWLQPYTLPRSLLDKDTEIKFPLSIHQGLGESLRLVVFPYAPIVGVSFRL